MAIALDATASGVTDSGSGAASQSKTISHTLGSGSNRLVVVAVTGRGLSTPGTLTLSATYNGTSMTSGVTGISANNRQRNTIFYLLDASLPAAGTYNVVVTASDTSSKAQMVSGHVYSFTGASQSTPDASTTATGTSGTTAISNNLVTVANNAWIIDVLQVNVNVTGTKNGSQANAVTLAAPSSNEAIFSSTLGPVTPAGSTSTGWNTLSSSVNGWFYAQASFAPALTTITGTVAVTLDSFTPTASGGTGPSGTSTQTLASFTPTASGGTGPSGTSAQTLAAFAPSAAGGTGPSGTSAQTLGPFISTASGSAGAPAVTGPPLTVTFLDTGHSHTIRDRSHTASPTEV